MLAGLQGLDGIFRVGVVGGTDAYGFDFRIGQQRFYGRIGLAIVQRREFAGSFGVGVVQADDFRVGVLGVFRGVTGLGNHAAADDANFDFLHRMCTPFNLLR